MLNKFLCLLYAGLFVSCGVKHQDTVETVDFGDILRPYYETALSLNACQSREEVIIPVFGSVNHTISFDYNACGSDADGEMVNFSFKKKVITLDDYVWGQSKSKTPEELVKLNPNVEDYLYIDIPLFGVTQLTEKSVDAYLKARKTFHTIDWNICKIQKIGPHIWSLENPAFKSVPYPNYLIGDYATVKDWRENHEADKVDYENKYNEQRLKNRACANEQSYWYVVKDGILLTLVNPDSYVGGVGGVMPDSILYSRKE